MRDPLLFLAATLTGTYVAIYFARTWSTSHLASPSSLYSALVAVHFAVPGMLLGLEHGPEFVSSANREFAAEAMLFGLICLLVFQGGSLFINSKLSGCPRRSDGTDKYLWKADRVLVCVAALLAIGWAIRAHVIQSNAYFQILRGAQGSLEGPFYAAVRMVEQFPMYAVCILAIIYWRPNGPPSRWIGLALTFVVISEVAYWLPSGRKEPVFLAVIMPLLTRYLQQRRLASGRTLVALLAGAVLIFPATYIYRNSMELYGGQGNLVETVTVAVTMAESGITSADKGAGEILFERMSLLEPLSACVRLINNEEWKRMLGTSYAQALLSFIPRVIWPEKPDLHYGTDFGHAAGYLSRNDWLTSISVTYFGEAFLNFGWGGLVPIGLMGMIFGWLYRKATTSGHRETWLLLYLVAMPTILYTGGTFALHFGGLIKLLPFFYCVGWLMEHRRPVLSAQLPPASKG